MNDEPLRMKAENVFYIVMLLVVGGVILACFAYDKGLRFGRCAEICRPAKFDSDQKVNGGCLCIGSDKVLRFKEIP